MSRLIDADALKKAITQNREIDRNAVCDVLDIIDDAPTVDTYTEDDVHYAIKEGHEVGYGMAKAKFGRPQGEWIDTGNMEEYWEEEYQCSICGVKDHRHTSVLTVVQI